ncbi:uncharacterized protein LOC108477767 [Gossypium arboreum]|uniref:uncharacterized protein LOC108477767 n=1 Tax=Gossypium arboreum TaxID=29729 RepID=UPI000818F526|nr:uncharacterized protein LOC108477767 [Gossypium arboreum]
MDWLVKHQVNLDCAIKRMVLRTVEGDEVVVIKDRDYLSNVISTLRAEKLVNKGCEAYLAYIGVLDFEASSVKDIKTVKDFLDVFPDELPGLLPNHEGEFRLELLPGIAPFWKRLHEALGTGLDFNTAFHPQKDGQPERVI